MRSVGLFLVCLCLPAVARAEGPITDAKGGLTVLDAVKTTLSLHAAIRLQEQDVILHHAALQVASGQFDTNLIAALGQRGDTLPLTLAQQADEVLPSGQLAGPGETWSAVTTQTTSYNLGVSQQLRWGTTITPELQLNRIAATGAGPPYGQARLVFAVVQPLLQGRGADAVAAKESSAKKDEEASMLLLHHTVAVQIEATLQAYWAWRAAQVTVDILKDAEHRAQELLDEEQRLVQAHEHPPADSKQLEANLADAHTAVVDGERAAIEARQVLGVAMGIGWQEMEQLKAPVSDLPNVDDAEVPAGPALQHLVEGALARRADYRAAGVAVQSLEVLAHGAKRDTEPQLNLEVDLGYNGLTVGDGPAALVTPIANQISGVNFFTNLSFAFPVQNNVARGTLGQRDTLVREAVITRDELARVIGSNVSIAAQSLRRAALARRSGETAVAAYREAVTNERKKLRAGLSTNIDVILTEQHLTSAELALVQEQVRVATDLATLRFESGTLVEKGDTRSEIGVAELTTAPR